MRQRSSSPNCTQRTPAGLPFGMPGIGLVIEGAVQQAPHCGRHWKEADMDIEDCLKQSQPVYLRRRQAAGNIFVKTVESTVTTTVRLI